MTKIKICGLMREEDVDIINELHPDLTGFIFARDRRRYISPETAKRFKERLDPTIRTVGVFAGEPLDTIYEISKLGVMDLVQLHGFENEVFVQYVRDMTMLPIIKAYRVRSEEDVQAAAMSYADMVLLDNGVGGTGESFDHELLRGIDRPYIVAGGLNPENAAGTVLKYAPYGVDVSSGVETNGYKDHDKVKRFIEAVRAADNEAERKKGY